MGRMIVPTEHEEQVCVVQWWDKGAAHAFGLTSFHLFAIPNAGAGASKGQAGKMKAEGARPGIPDLFLAVPRGAWHGMFVEMKRAEGGRVSTEQNIALGILGKNYRCVIANGADEAMRAIRNYLA